MEKKDLLLDIDEVFCFSGFLPAINDFLGTDYKIDDFTEYYIDEAVIPQERFEEFNKYLASINQYEKAEILPYAIESLIKINEYYNIYPCSSCINPFDKPNSGRLFYYKYNFLMQNLPFIKPENYIFTDSKFLFKAYAQMDDRLQKLNNDIPIKILFPAYHNRNITVEDVKKENIFKAGNDWRTGWLEATDILLDVAKKPKIYTR